MKKISAILVTLCCVLSTVQAQEEEGFSYRAVVRTAAGAVLSGQPVGVRFSVLQTSAEGTAVYTETHTVATDAGGGIQVVIGKGQAVNGQFSAIDWSAGPWFIRTEYNLGQGFTLSGVQQLLSVPYTLAASTAEGLETASPDGTVWRLQADDNGRLSTHLLSVPIPDGYTRMVFHDEFDGEGLPDSTKWGYEDGIVRNGEYQYYTVNRLENCHRSDGYLHIVCRNDSFFVKDAKVSYWPVVLKDTVMPVTSASIRTAGKASWTYCRVEVRAKLPLCRGTWPAIWMMPEEPAFYGGWPNSGEIDIMEHVGYDPGKVYYTLHCKTYNHSGPNGNPRTSSAAIANENTEFHVYALEWRDGEFEFFLDGKLKYRVRRGATDSWQEWPFHRPFYLILNQTFGGGWGGQQGIDLKGLPQDYVIDYVRVFQ